MKSLTFGRRVARRIAGLLVLCCCVLSLAGCTPRSAGFISLRDGAYVLTIPQKCGLKIANVSVAYYTESSEPSPNLWTAKADVDSASNEVVLFQPNAGYKTEGDASSVDFRKLLNIGFGEGPQSTPAGVTGILADLGSDQVLWANGITSAKDYESATTGGIPGGYRCVERKG